MTPGPRRAPLLAPLVLLLAACGSTAAPHAVSGGTGPAADEAALSAPGGGGLGVPSVGDPGVDVPAGTVGAVDGGGSTDLGSGSSGPARSAPDSSGGAAAGGDGASSTGSSSVAAPGPGVTATTITIGLAYATNTEARGKALGVGNVETGDPLAQQRVFVNDINSKGGILGRQLVVVEHPIDATSTEPYSVQAQEECSTFTEDNKVFAVLDGGGDDTLRECVHKARGVLVEDTAQSYVDARTFRRYPYYIEPAGIGQDRIAAAWTPALQAQGYFAKWDHTTGMPGEMPVKVGVLLLDDPADVYAYETFLAPAVKAAGYAVQDFRVASPKSTGDSGTTVSQIQSAVLQFRSDGVTHFLPLDSGAGLALYFANNANSQRYYPRYGVNSGGGIQALIEAGLFPKEQLNGAVGFGWSPFLDVSAADNSDDGPNSNALRRYCLKLLKDNGQEVSGSVAKRGAVEQCTKFYFLKAAIEAGGPAVNRTSFLAGVHALGSGFVAANTFRTLLSPGRHAGVNGIRNTAYDGACGCFRYTSPLRSL